MNRLFLALALVCAGTVTARAESRRFSYSTSLGGPRLGVQVTLLTEELRGYFGAQKDAGILVGKVEPGSAAEKAGVRVGDVLVTLGGATIDDAGDVRQALGDAKEGDTMPLTVVRDHKPVTLAVKVPKAEPAAEGFTLPDGMDGMQGFDFPREGMKIFKMSDMDKRLDAIEERLKKLEEKR
jgi:membrane-associated protease RseP (regulator of RpoE activity)